MAGQKFIIMLSLVCSGCASVANKDYLTAKQEFLQAENAPRAYVDGYLDGCSSGRRKGGDRHYRHIKDEQRYGQEHLYKRGWMEAEIACRNDILIAARQQKDERAQVVEKLFVSEARAKRLEEEKRLAEIEMDELWEELKK